MKITAEYVAIVHLVMKHLNQVWMLKTFPCDAYSLEFSACFIILCHQDPRANLGSSSDRLPKTY
jgi:hypothetical protein